ncbi:cellulose biosynthesis protein BcsN [Microvirga sp. 2MCAF38]|uniref:cellulose biosynthesis protein BcsN n=1 Tax=Microvirga sp. 2MCAF38 TaxID=3232989 RepID=UPI003F987AA8
MAAEHWKRFAVTGAILLLPACSMRSDLHFKTLATEVPVIKAIVVPPPGGPAVVAVVENKFLNGVSQEVALSTAAEGVGQNAFWVSMMNDPDALTENDDVLTIRRITTERIQVEMDARLPGIDMRPSPYFVQNKYGPFGYALGYSAARDLCLYAWQLIEPTENAIFSTSGIVSVRLRLCEAGATEEQLLRTMYAYTISAYFEARGWNPYGSPGPVSPQLGQIDAPVYPLPTGVTVLRTAPPPSPRPQTVIRRAPAKPPVIAPETENVTRPASLTEDRLGFPVVPPPP